MSVAYLKDRSLGRIIAGHPWVYTADILRIEKKPDDGMEITVRSATGSYIGNGFYNSKSQIPIRIFSRSKEELDETFFQKRLSDAKAFRAHHPHSSYRLVWSEGDFLPGLIIDAYDKSLVIQTLTLAMDQRKEMLVRLLKDLYHPDLIVERNDVASRQFEGLSQQKGVLYGNGNLKPVMTIGKVKFEVDLLEGQKTGTYLDQCSNQILVGNFCHNKRVLDCFTYRGGFALQAAAHGASEVEAVDISEDAITACKHNAELNGISKVKWKSENVFDDLNARVRRKENFDLVVLDPPSFTKSRAKLEEALRGYKEIHLRALKLLNKGGFLATFCCSHHVDSEIFRSVILDAAFDARKILRLRETFCQSPDHPVIPAIPETEYLKGYLFEIVG